MAVTLTPVLMDRIAEVVCAPIHYVRDFTFLPAFFDQGASAYNVLTQTFIDGYTASWRGPAYSGLDIETEGVLSPHDGDIATVQIELNGECWVVHWDVGVKMQNVPGAAWFRKYLESAGVCKVVHNLKFETAWFVKAFGWDLRIKNVHDTMAGEYILAEGAGEDEDNWFAKPKLDLGSVVEKRYGVEMDKDMALRTGFRRRGNYVVYAAEKKGDAPTCADCGKEALVRVGSTDVCGICVLNNPAYRTKTGKPRAQKPIDRSLYERKREQKWDLTQRELEYAAFDALWAARIAQDQIDAMSVLEIQEGEQYLPLLTLDSKTAVVLGRMELHGIPVNEQKLMCLDAEWQYRELMLREDIEEATCFASLYNVLKQQEPELRYEDLSVRLGYWKEPSKDAIKKAKEKGEPEPTAKFVEAVDFPKITSGEQMVPRLQAMGYKVPSYEGHELRHYKGDRIVDNILSHKAISKLQGTYSSGFLERINRNSGRVHGGFNQFVTSTGRLSAVDPNLQNLPSKSEDGLEIRASVQAPPGFEFVIADYSQIELRLIAQMYNCPVMREMFVRGLDIHSYFAAKMLGVSYEEVNDNKDGPYKVKRSQAKPANFGLGYGAGVDQFMFIAWSQYGIVLTREEATTLRSLWLQTFIGVAAYHEQMKQMLKNGTGPVKFRTQDGRVRRMKREWRNAEGERKTAYAAGLNHPIQGTGADGTKRAMVRIDAELPRDAHMMLQVHDELVTMCRVEDVELVKQIMERAMREEMQRYLPDIPCVVDVHSAAYWKK